MERQTKIEAVDSLKKELQGKTHIFLCNFQGLSVEKDTQLRRDIRTSGGTYKVVKNTLLKLAFADSSFDQLNDHLKGNTAIAYHESDLVAIAKLIAKHAKENEKFTFKAGVVEGKVVEVKDLETISNLPSKEELLSKLVTNSV